jgi:hypothetical protein
MQFTRYECACVHVCMSVRAPCHWRHEDFGKDYSHSKGTDHKQAAAEECTNWRFAIAVSDCNLKTI